MGGFAGSKIREVHGERMINRTFDPGFRIALLGAFLSVAQGFVEIDVGHDQHDYYDDPEFDGTDG